ncbi:MAG: hypothetical protein GF331_04120 [Chitinivibrionales bacterium]|nr:hypothetical protein [Chitinivibrionales bacterium]
MLGYAFAVTTATDPRDPADTHPSDPGFRHHVSMMLGYRRNFRQNDWYQRLSKHW